MTRARRTRSVLAVVGVVLSSVLVVAAILGVWARRSFLETEVFAKRAGHLIAEERVRTALAGYLADEINALIDPAALFEEALPERAQILVAPLSGAVEGFVQDKVDEVVDSERFADLWRSAVEVAHREVIRILEGRTPLAEERDDRVVINLLPVVNAALARIGEASPELFGREVDLPTITVEDVPDEARQRIADALGVTLDDDFGTFTIYDEGALTAAQDGVALTDRLVWVLVVLVPVAIVATLAVSPRRRRTALQLAIAVAAAMVVVRRIVLLFQDDLLALVRVDRNRPAVEAASDAFLDPLLDGAGTVGVVALVAAAVLALTGPYAWALGLRRGTVRTVQGVRTTVSERSRDEATLAWIAARQDGLRLAGAGVGLALLWWLDLSWPGFFVLAGLVVAYEVVVSRLAERSGAGEAP